MDRVSPVIFSKWPFGLLPKPALPTLCFVFADELRTAYIYASFWGLREIGWVNDFSGRLQVGYVILLSLKGWVAYFNSSTLVG